MNAIRLVSPALSILLALAASACVAPEEEPLGTAEEAAENANALNANALNANALNANALNANALSANALNANALNANALSTDALHAIQASGPAGELSRELLRYVVSCALDSTQSFDFSWSDAEGDHQETYPGLLGLAPAWSTGPLDIAGQRWVSACLASRVNWYRIPVTISSRAAHPALNKEGLPELVTFPREEGAFWGNLFTASPAVFACHAWLDNSHSRARRRDCAAGHLSGNHVEECGIIHIVGSCDTYCQPLDLLGGYRPRCVSNLGGNLLAPFLSNPTATTAAITVFLP